MTLSRTFACATGGHGIHEAPGEQNHIYLVTRRSDGTEYETGPWCPDCAAGRLNVSLEELRKMQEANRALR